MNDGEPITAEEERELAPVRIEVFGKYYLIDRIGSGGMGEIFRAMSFGAGGVESLLAIKRISAPPSSDDRFVRMFMDEAKVFAVLQAANIVRMYDFGKVEDNYYIAMECVEGKDVKVILSKLARRRALLPTALAVYIAMEAAKGLEYAHKRTSITGEPLNIVHRDINPSNILVSYLGEVKVGDFGIVRAATCVEKTDVGAITGKLGYMSPEQAYGLHLDHRSDIFALGVLLHEMLTGRRLFKGVSEVDTLERVRRAEVLPPSATNALVPPRLDAIVMRALALEPDNRYQSAREMQAELVDFLRPASSELIQELLSRFMLERFAYEERCERERALAGSVQARRMHEQPRAVGEPGTTRFLPIPTAPSGARPRLVAGRTMVPPYTQGQVERMFDGPADSLERRRPTPSLWRTWWRRFFARRAPAQESVAGPSEAPRTEPRTTARSLFVESPAPWDGGEVVAEPDVPNVRVHLTERLHSLRETAPSRNDWLFIDRLVRACSAPQLDFPLFPTGARRLDWLLRAGDIDQKQVVEVVIREPGMLKRVWEEASSAAFGASPPANVPEAVMRLGHRRLWQIAMSASMNAKVFQARNHQAKADHLREVSTVAAEVSIVFDPAGDAYLAALLHGLGKLVVYRCGPSRKPEESASAEFVSGVADLVYPSVGMLLAQAWNLGSTTAVGIGFAPSPELTPRGHQLAALATRAASIAAHEAWALGQARTFDGFVALTSLGFPNEVAVRGLDAADVAWRKVRQTTH